MHWVKTFAAVPLLMLGVACAPAGYETAGYTGSNWPSSDQPTTAAQKVEIESLLTRLGYFHGAVDGAITADTRVAAAKFQHAIGAPANGFTSPALLNALRSNAGVVAPVATKVKVAPKAKPGAPTPGYVGGGGGGGGAGGGGGGAWN